MAAAQCFVYKNDGTNTNTHLTSTAYPTMPSASALGWSRDGYTFVNWNSESDGSGTSIEVGDVNPADYEVYYAIWEEDAPSYDVTISYKSNVIATMSASGTKTLKTSGKYCEDDITVEYTKPSGGGDTGASNYVHGEFTTQSTAGVQTVTIPYTGSGYPIMAYVVIKGGAYVSGTDWYKSVQRYATGVWSMSKSIFSSAPTYTTSGNSNQAVTFAIYKNSTTNSASYTRTSAMTTNTFSSLNAGASSATCVRFTGNSKTLTVYVNTNSYGLLPNQDYEYFIVYSS